MKPLVLASASPQRRDLLGKLGVSFIADPSRIDERACGLTDPVERAAHLARQKAEDIIGRHPGSVIIGCDTLVVSPRGTLLEKPADADEAERMLREQSGGISVVHSGLCIVATDGEMHEGMDSSNVHFAELSDDDVRWWIETNLWKDRSGAFQIDGPGQLMIKKIEGDWTGVVGLPVFLLGKLLREAGYSMQ